MFLCNIETEEIFVILSLPNTLICDLCIILFINTYLYFIYHAYDKCNSTDSENNEYTFIFYDMWFYFSN